MDVFLPFAALDVLRRLRPGTSMARYVARLADHPGTVVRRAGKLTADLAGIAAGRSTIAPQRRDRRFSDPAWNENPMLKRTVQAYLAYGRSAEGLLVDAGLGWRDNERLKWVLTNLIAAAAPSNYPLISPVAWKAFIDTGGLSAVRGLRALVSDMSSPPFIPAMVAPGAFEIGKDLAVTPGAVVARTDVFELIQYQPATETVHRFPLLVVPPMINKYYIADLAPGRSMLEFFVAQGYQVFVISWRNPGKRHSRWNLNTYGEAVAESLSAACEITQAPKASLAGLCAGGIVSAMLCAQLAATGQLDRVAEAIPAHVGQHEIPAAGSRTRYLRLSAVGDAARHRGPLPGEEPASGRGDSGGLARRAGSHQDLERSARRIVVSTGRPAECQVQLEHHPVMPVYEAVVPVDSGPHPVPHLPRLSRVRAASWPSGSHRCDLPPSNAPHNRHLDQPAREDGRLAAADPHRWPVC